MEEEKHPVQRELFKEFSQQTKGSNRFAWFKKPLSFRPLVFVFSYEKFIFLIIALMIILAIIFCLGVEQGKRMIALTTSKSVAPAAADKPAASPAAVPTPIMVKKEVLKTKTEAGAAQDLKWVVQLASLMEKSSVDKEVTNLKNRGYPSFWASSGKYYVVYAGPFAGKEQAQTALNKLKTTYKDASIRKR